MNLDLLLAELEALTSDAAVDAVVAAIEARLQQPLPPTPIEPSTEAGGR